MKKIILFVLLFSSSVFSQMNFFNNKVRVNSYGSVSYVHPYVSAFKEDTTIVVDCTAQDVYVKLGGLFNSTGITEQRGLTASLGDSSTIVVDGNYRYIFSWSGYGDNGVDFKVGMFKNSVKQYAILRTTTGGTNRVGGTLVFTLHGLVAGDDICIKVTNLTNPYTADLTITNASLILERISVW